MTDAANPHDAVGKIETVADAQGLDDFGHDVCHAGDRHCFLQCVARSEWAVVLTYVANSEFALVSLPMAHPPSPTGSVSDGISATSSASPQAADEQAVVAELRDVVASLRARLKWIQHGGTDGLPMPTAKRARPPQSVAAGGGARTNLVNQSVPASAAGPIGPRPSSAPVPRSAPPVDVASPDSDDPAVLARAAVENASRLAARTVLPTARPASRRPESPSAVAAAPVFKVVR